MSDETKPETTPESPAPELKTYRINYQDKESFIVKASSVAWTENGLFILLMDGETVKHVVVAANVIAVTEA